MCFYAYNRVLLRIVGWIAAEELDSNHGLLQPLRIIAGLPGCQESEKVPQPRCRSEDLAAADSLKLLTHPLSIGWERVYQSKHLPPGVNPV